MDTSSALSFFCQEYSHASDNDYSNLREEAIMTQCSYHKPTPLCAQAAPPWGAWRISFPPHHCSPAAQSLTSSSLNWPWNHGEGRWFWLDITGVHHQTHHKADTHSLSAKENLREIHEKDDVTVLKLKILWHQWYHQQDIKCLGGTLTLPNCSERNLFNVTQDYETQKSNLFISWQEPLLYIGLDRIHMW